MKLETKVGGFFVLTIGVLGMLVLRMEKIDMFSGHSDKQLVTEFDQAAGLTVQSAIRVAGVPVGKVAGIDLDGKKARVTLSLPKDFPIYSDASIQLSAIGILGEKYIDLDPGHPTAGLMPVGQAIPSKTGMSMDALLETLGAISKDVKNVTAALSESIGGEHGREKLDEIIDNIRQLTGEFRAMAQENHGAINATMANVQAISGDMKDNLPKLTRQFEELGRNLNDMVTQGKPELQGLLTDVRKLTANLQGTSENVKSITDKMNKGEGTIGKLLNDPSTVEKLNLAVDNVNSMLGGFRSMDLNLDLNASQWTKRGNSATGLTLDIVPAHDHWYSIGFNSTPDGKISTSTYTTSGLNGAGQEITVPTTIQNVNVDQTFTLSAQFVKRLAEHYVLSAGIVESKGGGGAEFRALDDHFRLGVLAYDFTKTDEKPKPRYRATTSYQFYKSLYLQAGVQDIANPALRSFFFGGGLRWKDDDLKKLVGLASVGK
jgi:phospholipid/cholesterol/gamma-HCH transport system substrate-binding protein